MRRKDRFSDQIYICVLIFSVIIVGLVQLIMINKLRFVPSFDLDAIYGGAVQWIETGSFPDYYDYFDWFPNNLGGLCFLYLMFKAGTIFTADYFAMAAVINMIIILSTVILTSLTARKLWGNKCGLLALVLFMCMPPLYFMADAFYTDSLSILFPISLFYISLKIKESKGTKLIILCMASGLLAAVGSLVKPTVMIMVVAISLSFLLQKRWTKLGIYIVSVGIIYLMITIAFQSYIYENHLNAELARIKNTPVYHWVMMGLSGDGGYNPADYDFTRSFSNPKIRDAALRNEIKNRIAQKGMAGMIALYAAKLVRCFGDGTLGISDFLDDNPCQYSRIHDYILYSGDKYPSYKSLCNTVFYTLLLFMLICVVIEMTKGKRAELISAVLAMIGITVFLMHWETSARYITNYVPVILVLATGGIRYLGYGVGKMRMKEE